jgi:uncharacterized protein
MKIIVAGGTGLLGSALVSALQDDRHAVVVLTRHPARQNEVRWSPDHDDGSWTSALDGAHAVINLAGASIAGGRWTAARKTAIHDSRMQATGALVRAITATHQPPPIFISSSAVGYYGSRGDDPATETTAPGSDFLAQVCRDWEAVATRL